MNRDNDYFSERAKELAHLVLRHGWNNQTLKYVENQLKEVYNEGVDSSLIEIGKFK